MTETAIPAAGSPAEGDDRRPYDADADGFPAFYAKWHPQLRRWALQHHGDANGDEIAQETLCRAFVHFGTLRQDVPWPWLRTVAQNVACDLYRRSSCLDAEDVAEAAPDVADPRPGPEELMLRAEVTEHVRAALSSLRQRDRELLTMAVHQDMSVEDIAAALGTRRDTVRVQLHRARQRLGSLYLDRIGTLVVLPVTACAWALRQARRATQPAVPMVAPTALSLAAVVATVGVVSVTWPAGSDGTTTIKGSRSMVQVAKAADETGSRVDATRSTQRLQPRGLSTTVTRPTPSDVDLGAAPPGAPVAVGAKADVADDPTGRGRIHTEAAAMTIGIGSLTIDGHGDRDTDRGAICYVTRVTC